MRSSGRRALAAGAVTWALAATPGHAQEGPIGPCSPYRAADGDIPSEMPGCARRLRPAPGTLGDELEFRRARRSLDAGDAALPDDEAPAVRPRGKRRRPAR